MPSKSKQALSKAVAKIDEILSENPDLDPSIRRELIEHRACLAQVVPSISVADVLAALSRLCDIVKFLKFVAEEFDS